MEKSTKSAEAPGDEVQAKQRFDGKVLKTTLQGGLIDIGSKLPAFIHISQIVKDNDPKASVNSIEEVLKVGQEVSVWVKRVKKDRIELTMKEPLVLEWREIKPDMVVKGKIIRLETFGAFAEIVPAPFTLNHFSINLSTCHIANFTQTDINETFIMAQIQVRFRAIIQHKDFAVLIRAHRARINVQIRIKLLNPHAKTTLFEQSPNRRCS